MDVIRLGAQKGYFLEPRNLPPPATQRRVDSLGKPEKRRAIEKEVRRVLGPEGPEVMDFLKDELERRLPDHEERGSILSGLVGAVVTEEVTRQATTKQPMTPGQMSDIDKSAVISRWKCLAEHYRGSRYEQHLRDGVEQLEGLLILKWRRM